MSGGRMRVMLEQKAATEEHALYFLHNLQQYLNSGETQRPLLCGSKVTREAGPNCARHGADCVLRLLVALPRPK